MRLLHRLFIACLILIPLMLLNAGLVWWVSTPEQRWSYRYWLGLIDTPPPMASDPIHHQSDLVVQWPPPPAAPLAPPPPQTSGTEPTATDSPEDACTPLSRPEAPTARTLYRWVDADGVVHYGDRQQHTAAAAFTLPGSLARGAEKLRLKVDSPDGNLPPFLPERLERDIRFILDALERPLPQEARRGVTIHVQIIHRSATYQQWQQRLAPTVSSPSGFYSYRHNLAVVGPQPNHDRVREVARHEAVHMINAALFGRLPKWLNEGLAEYYETLSEQGGRNYQVADHPHWRRLLQKLRKTRQLPALGTLILMDHDAWQAADTQTVYASAWSLVTFLRSNGSGRVVLDNLLRQLASERCNSFDSQAFLAQRYPGGLGRMERDWLRWISRGQSG